MVHYMGEGKNEKIGELKQSKCRNRKVFITDVAVDKVPLIQYKGLTGRQNRIMQIGAGGKAISDVWAEFKQDFRAERNLSGSPDVFGRVQ